MPASALAAAAAPVRRPAATSPARAAAAPRAGAPGTTVPTRPVAYRPPPATTAPAGAVTERPPPPSRRGRAVDEVLAHQNQNASGGPDLDDLDENTQVLQAVRSAPSPRQDRAQELELSWHSVLAEPPAAESADELTDPGLHARAIEALPPEDQTGPISAPERTAVTTWTEAERAAFMAAPDTLGPEPTSRRVAPLLAHRVAVIASSTPGEIRLVLLDASGAPPKGAAIALLVPLSATDGDVVTQLFGSLE
jgi:hypothetical protein